MAYPKSISLFSLSLALTVCFTIFGVSASSSHKVASEQLNLWYENVLNEMPISISEKLSPMSKKDCNYYSTLISNNENFSADSKLCSLAHLACNSMHAFKNSDASYKIYATHILQQQEVNEKIDWFFFFRLEKLKTGNVLHLPKLLTRVLPNRSFLPHEIASLIDLNSETIHRIFPNITASKAVKEAVDESLLSCNAPSTKGETMTCPKSLEEMIWFAKSALGATRLITLTSDSTKGSDTEMIVRDVVNVNVTKMVACHEAFLPFAAYFCHSFTKTQLYEVDLVNGDTINKMLAICHMDTSPWPKDHVAFKILKFGPGQGEACHWFSKLDLTWIGAQ